MQPGLLTFQLFNLFSQYRQSFKQVANNSVVSDIKDGSLRVFVDGDDCVRILHAYQVLNRAGNPEGDIQLWRDCLSRLSDLTIDREPFGVADGTRCRQIATQNFGELLGQSDIVFTLDAAADSNDDICFA